MNSADLPAVRAAKQARRLAELDTKLDRCTRLLDEASRQCEQVARIEMRIERVRRDIDRLRSVGSYLPVTPQEKDALEDELLRAGARASCAAHQDAEKRIDGALPPPSARNPSLR